MNVELLKRLEEVAMQAWNSWDSFSSANKLALAVAEAGYKLGVSDAAKIALDRKHRRTTDEIKSLIK